MHKILLVCVLVTLVVCQQNGCCSSKNFNIIDDAALSKIVGQIRDTFISTRTTKFDRLDTTVILPTEDPKVWRRGSYGANATAYPASVIKMPFMVAAMHWCAQNGKPVDCLDHHVRPMVVESDNLETGIVVDIITGAPNIDDLTSISDPRYAPWLEKRKYTQNLFEKLGFLGNQIMLSKTYPTNSGWPLSGAEKVQRDHTGGNVLQPCCMATFLLEIIHGTILPEPRQKSIDYVKSVLYHRVSHSHAPFGFGVPPGTVLENKSGLAYDTLEDVSHITLPNRKSFFMAAFSNAYQRPTDDGALGTFAESVIQKLNLNAGGPWGRTLFAADNGTHLQGDWRREVIKDKLGAVYFKSADTSASAHWNVQIPEDGLYRISIYHPSDPNAFTSTTMIIKHAYGTDTLTVNQRLFSRWRKLGDFQLKAGSHTALVRMTGKGLTGSSHIIADAIKIEKYPSCNGLPGYFCRNQ
jgi:hypothetical protein